MRHRLTLAGATAAAAVLGATAVLVLWPDRGNAPVTPPPITPAPGAAVRTDATLVPPGLMRLETRTASPLDQDGFRWVRNDGTDLPPLVDPCGDDPAGAPAAVHQIALVGPTLWKAERLLLYPDPPSAAAAFAAHRAALVRCARHDHGDGTRTEWSTAPAVAGTEALFVTGQRYRGADAIPGNHRGVLMRAGRAIVMYVDFGQRTAPARLADVPSHIADARAIAEPLARLS